MLFPQRFWAGLADGSVTVAFRRWKRPTVKHGGSLQTPGGLMAIDALERIELADITGEDARAAGYESADEAISSLRPDGDLYRVRFHRVGDDPRIGLRERADLHEDEMRVLRTKLVRLGWGAEFLALIGAHPGVVSTELAAQLGLERLPFKQKVRRLKELGLTESLVIGYRLSPRGEAVLRAVSGRES